MVSPFPKKNQFLFLVFRQFLFPKTREFMRDYSVFRKTVLPFDDFSPKKNRFGPSL